MPLANDLKSWGYRDIESDEFSNSRWFPMFIEGEFFGWAWLESNPQLLDKDRLLHVCVNPDFKGHWSKRLLRGLGGFAAVVGCTRLWAVPPAQIAPYLRRMAWLGWKEPRPGVFFLEVA